MAQKLNNKSIELLIISACANDQSFAAKMVAHLEPEFISTPSIQSFFVLFKKLYLEYKTIPSLVVIEAEVDKVKDNDLKSKFVIIKDKAYGVENIPKVDNKSDVVESDKADVERVREIISKEKKDYLLDQVMRMSRKHRLIKAATEIEDMSREDDFTDEMYKEAMQMLRDTMTFNLDKSLGVSLYEVAERYIKIRLAMCEKISTGYAQMDFIADGGFARKELVCIQGIPGGGKSKFLVNLGHNFASQGYKVIHYSMEMSEERLSLRYDAIQVGESIKTLATATPEVIERVEKAYSGFKVASTGEIRIKEFPTATASALDLESHLDELVMHYNFVPDVIIVDYGDIMRSAHPSKGSYEEQGWIFRELRALAITRNTVVLTATQTTRSAIDEAGGSKDVIGMDKTADSIEKGRILDFFLSITQSAMEREMGDINLYVAKHRNGTTGGRMSFKEDPFTLRISESGRQI